jgi:hypothetical protein
MKIWMVKTRIRGRAHAAQAMALRVRPAPTVHPAFSDDLLTQTLSLTLYFASPLCPIPQDHVVDDLSTGDASPSGKAFKFLAVKSFVMHEATAFAAFHGALLTSSSVGRSLHTMKFCRLWSFPFSLVFLSFPSTGYAKIISAQR